VNKIRRKSGPPGPNDDPPSDSRSADEFWRLMAHYAPAIGLMPASILAGYLIGYGLDYLFATTFLRFVFMILGVVSGIVQLVRLLSRDVK
jgi:F0F1-type ATP synthase assembly protein I